MAKLTLDDIADLRAYERERAEFRSRVIALKRDRRVALGPVVTIVFENATTMRFQIQEMARAERLMSDEAIQHELDTYNPLIPGPGELSMTLFIELTSEAELRSWLPRLVGVERAVGLVIGEGERIAAALDAAHERQLTRETVTASVHYLRIRLDEVQRARFRAEPSRLVIDHPSYRHEAVLSPTTVASLVADWSDD